jgi:PPOX class probable F420-dependent enzyme
MEALTNEQRAFLQQGTRTGKLATVRKNGRPHVVPIWFEVDGDALMFTTGGASVKAMNIKRDEHVSLCVDDEEPPFSFITIDGIATIVEDRDALLYWATRVAGRYMGSDKAEEYGKRNSDESEVLVRITPTHVVFALNLAD